MSPPKLHNLPASPSRKGSLSPNWRERDSNSSYYPEAGSLTSVLNSSIDRMGTSMNASIDRMGNSISASILDMSAAVGKSLEKNNDNLNRFDSLGSRMDLGFQSITQRLSDIQVIARRDRAGFLGIIIHFLPVLVLRVHVGIKVITGVFIVMNLVIFKQLVLNVHQISVFISVT